MPTVKISPKFKSQAYKAIFSIVLFIIVYMLLLVLAVGIFVGCGYGAITMIGFKPSFITLMLGIGIIGVGFFILFFMVKFLFAKNKTDYSYLTEINLKDEPELYNMIQELVDEIGTDFPKKIYISPQVNASVFYDSGFWSMFFPVKKNLHIGMGLVNATTVTELKGILAHEFGHFSQKSMKVGSYVYNVNKIIYNLLYENDDYGNVVSSWANKSGYFAFLIHIAFAFNRMIQYVLQFMYKIVNVNYMGLSREMEFHADEIAANTVGSEPMINSMLRMDLASNSFDNVLDYYNRNIEKSVTTSNIFPQHTLAMNFMANSNKIAIEHNLPKVESDFYERFNKSKLVVKNQWESHPATDERVMAFKKLNVSLKHTDNRPANVLFHNAGQTQEKVTKKMFEAIVYPEPPTEEDISHFETSIKKDYEDNKYPELYNGYYDNHSVTLLDLDTILQNPATDATFDELYNNTMVELVYSKNGLTNDLETLQQIARKEFKIKTFDYDGKKYKAADAQLLVDNLERELTAMKEKIKANDIEIFKFFYAKALPKAADFKLLQCYKDFFKVEGLHEKKVQFYIDMFEKFSFSYEQNQIEDINNRMSNYYVFESKFKAELKETIADELYQKAITPEFKTQFEAYLDKDLSYFDGAQYDNEAIITKNNILFAYFSVLQRSYFLNHKAILDFQISLL
ncbi:M48 family metalloprotease [Flavobacterium sp. J49]|uniref:M48 family metallopeptidase n=1 Tax=Flavobacterium sp. J49 TaxID=2718534 RepID=UPI0015933D6F|nr:M48 family metallopeptidase [Flavobacterium sp. J49]MBF6642022.1 M48 family metalloprotease [Flavobacterium sp. J49]NIC03270.1 M48 family metalloprotease [Flavobacterium sp. J49]